MEKRTTLNQKIYACFDPEKNLPQLCLDLLSEQKRTWPDLQKGYQFLEKVRMRDVTCREFSVRLQYNPGRIRSSTAEVSRKKVNEQHCFLCLDHLPESQKGVLYVGNYLILCNPMPVFHSHFTVSHLDHRPQAIAEQIGTLLRLMGDLGPDWMVLYNGPRCGASAPDHLHFQIIPSGKMPIEREISEQKRLLRMTKSEGVSLYRLRDLGREVILLEGEKPSTLENVLKMWQEALKSALKLDEEPMINIAGFYEGAKFRLLIFPRQKHRPDAFFKEGKDRIVISPGAIDMGGFLITPVEKDFNQLDGMMVESIYKEVSIDPEGVEKAFQRMDESLREKLPPLFGLPQIRHQ